ncbi:glycosyltransferase [Maricaulis sp.]|uniref:glycosyltransferase family 2 protein n=1 Tax=Maricaulis sp. TaxID=1486257 RepID=UPI0025B9ED14|nr:glycosyltransferase [Maricaulis sp.]
MTPLDGDDASRTLPGTEARDGPRARQDRPWLPDGGQAFRPTRIAQLPRPLAHMWCDQAAYGLPRRAPQLSAHGQASRGLAITVLLGLLAGFALLLFAPGLAAALAGGLVCLLFAALIGLRLAATLLAPHWQAAPSVPDADLPTACIMVAMYDEARVVGQLAASLAAIDYPADRVQFKCVLEADDHETIQAVRALGLDARFEIILVPPGEPRTKPRALNYALRLCRSELVTVHDAEDRPDPAQLRRAAEAFRAGDARLACIQAPLNWFNREETWLTRQFALEYAAHFNALLPLYQRLGWPLPLGGTSNHFRRDALLRVGGWDAWNVTEDADLGLRLHAAGYRCGLIAPTTLEEAPLRLAPWIKQRTRWIKGYAQTLAVLATRPDTPWKRLWPGALVLGGAALSALIHGPLSLACLAILVLSPAASSSGLAALAFMLVGYASAIGCAAVAMRRAGLACRLRDLAAMPACWLLQTLAAARALRQLLIDPHHWEKTEHGLSAMTGRPCTFHSSPPSLALPPASGCFSSPAGAPASRSARSEAPASSPGP